MSEVIVAALIGIGGAVAVAVCSFLTQLFLTKTIIRAEQERLANQLQDEDALRRKGKRQEQILDTMSELLVVSDPETSGGIDSGRCGNLITRLQLLLDLSVLPEKQLNGALNQLGLGIRDYVSMSGLTEVEKRELLLLHSRVVDLAGVVIRELPARIE